MYTKKRDGTSTEPWGTPDVTAKQLEDTPSTTTLWYLSNKKFSIHFMIVVSMPVFINFAIRGPCGTLSKALERSNIAAWTEMLSIIFIMSSTVVTSWVVQDKPCQKPCDVVSHFISSSAVSGVFWACSFFIRCSMNVFVFVIGWIDSEFFYNFNKSFLAWVLLRGKLISSSDHLIGRGMT